MRSKALLLLTACSAFIVGCGQKADSRPTSNFLYAAARNIAPAVKPTSATGAGPARPALARAPGAGALDMPWWSGNMGGVIYQTLREYQYPRDEGSIDGTNLYKMLFDAGYMYESNETFLDAITEKPVASPFDFGAFAIADTYDKGKNGANGQAVFMAARQVGNTRHLLAAMKQGDVSMVMQGVHDGDTKELELNAFMVIRYTSGSMAGDTYGIRSYIKGNEATHAFQFRLLSFNHNGAMDMSYYYSVMGMGVSQGAGNHFLFYGSSTYSAGTGGPSTGSYCFAAGDGEAEYRAKFTAYPEAVSGGGEPIAGDSPCHDYKAGAGGIDDQLAAHPMWGSADITFDPTTFTGGGSTHLELGL